MWLKKDSPKFSQQNKKSCSKLGANNFWEEQMQFSLCKGYSYMFDPRCYIITTAHEVVNNSLHGERFKSVCQALCAKKRK